MLKRKLSDSLLAGRDLSKVKNVFVANQKKEFFSNLTDDTIAWSHDVIFCARKGAWYGCKFYSALSDDMC